MTIRNKTVQNAAIVDVLRGRTTRRRAVNLQESSYSKIINNNIILRLRFYNLTYLDNKPLSQR